MFAPQLVADSAGFIHAFWLGEESELFQSFVPTEGFADFGSWIVPRSLGQDVVKFEVLTGTNGQLHLAYITNTDTPEAPAGLYYRRSIDSGETWSEPAELYQSPYFRLLTSDNAHLNMSLDISDLYISWDNRPRERVFLIHSQNNGTTWGTPVEIDRRQEDDSSEDVSPRNILVANYNSQLHVTWQAGHKGNNCNQIHQWSEDEGATWQTDPNFWNEFQGCPNSVEFLPGDAGLFMLTNVADVKYLYVWSESEWYEP
ncbi:MAG: hypothetical protein GWN00_07985, partial [Aliifodinibius sp.]|nr:exo-alpha-sialidase [Fodinibius sp.]NIY24748.1 hypothetical protein [Fodinibius sp.]